MPAAIATLEARGAAEFSDDQARIIASKLKGRRIGGVIQSGNAQVILRVLRGAKKYPEVMDEWLDDIGAKLVSERATWSNPYHAKLYPPQ